LNKAAVSGFVCSSSRYWTIDVLRPWSKIKQELRLGLLKFGCKLSSKLLSFGCHSTCCSTIYSLVVAIFYDIFTPPHFVFTGSILDLS
jgi:hypothetical protein